MRTVDERSGGLAEAIRSACQAESFALRVAMPGIVRAWDASRQTVTVQLTIRERIRSGGAETEIEIPPLVDVPVVMPRAGGFCLAFAPAPGDECLVVFSDLCIDAWWQSGGVQSQADRRRHDLSDGFAILGCWSQPNRPALPESGARLQNDSGTAGVAVTERGVHIFGPLTINGIPYAGGATP